MDLKRNFHLNDWELLNFVNLTDEEREMVRKWRNHDNVMKWMYSDHVISSEGHAGFIKKLQEDNHNFYWLVKSKGEKYVGVIYLNRVDFKNKNAYLGIYSSPVDKLPGTGQLLISSLRKLVFDMSAFHALKLEVVETNETAIHLYKKGGFKQEGRLRDFVFKDGKWLDVIIMGILNSEESK
jgi:UDP-4-amino-4,6-dideoxy-N-acetyl-beta-L-altrosamine N-acetyltransferase